MLQLNNRLFEELAMDVYDEVDRRENDAGEPHPARLLAEIEAKKAFRIKNTRKKKNGVSRTRGGGVENAKVLSWWKQAEVRVDLKDRVREQTGFMSSFFFLLCKLHIENQYNSF